MINIEQPQIKIRPEIVIIGVGGGGGNAVNTMIGHGIDKVKYIAANTDYQALQASKSSIKLQLGLKLTRGLGAGAIPEVGQKAAEESYEDIKKELMGADMVFVVAGMGGGTGTGAAPVVASIAKELGALTIGVVTTPFRIEGKTKLQNALKGLENLKKEVDSYIVISNDKIVETCPKGTTVKKAFEKGNEVLKNALTSIVTIITDAGVINADFADIRTIMENKGRAHIGYGVAKGEDRAKASLRQALTSPLLETTIKGAGYLLTYVGSSEEKFDIDEFYEIGDAILEEVGTEPKNVITACGHIDSENDDEELVTIIIATDLPQNQGENSKATDTVKNISSSKKDEEEEKEEKVSISNNKETVVDISEAKVKPKRELNIPDWLK